MRKQEEKRQRKFNKSKPAENDEYSSEENPEIEYPENDVDSEGEEAEAVAETQAEIS